MTKFLPGNRIAHPANGDANSKSTPASQELPLKGLDIEQHNAWIDEIKEDVDFLPLRDFLDCLKEQHKQ